MSAGTISRFRRGDRRGAGYSLERMEDRTLLASYTAATVADLIANINAANASAGADTITLAAGKSFTLAAADHDDTGLPAIAAGGGSLTIVGNGDTIERSSASGTPAFRLFDVVAGASLTLRNLTLQGGLAAEAGIGGTPLPQGGVQFFLLPGQGGAIRNRGAANLDAVTIQNCSARGQTGTQVFQNPVSGSPALGGGIYSDGSLNLSGCTIRNNRAIGGTGIPSGAADGTNQYPGGRGADGCGGGVYIAGGTASINGSTLSGNGSVGGVGGDGGELPADDPGNGGNGLGGGLFAAAGRIELRNSTVTLNFAEGGAPGPGPKTKTKVLPGKGFGGGLYISASASAGLDQFTRNHVAQNTSSRKSDYDIFGKFSNIV